MTKDTYKIEILNPDIWRGYTLDFAYTSDDYYDLSLESSADGFEISFVKKAFPETYVNPNVTYDKLYQHYWTGATAYGVVEGKKLIAAIETCSEDWSNRLRVTELWVDAAYRRRGIGRALMSVAKQQASAENRRAIILETQSCNANAIRFYLSQGFSLIGFDSCCYSNRDIQRHEVRIEMGYMLYQDE